MKQLIRFFILFILLNIYRINAGIIVFYAPDCEECYRILTDSLFVSLEDKGIKFYDINNIDNYELLLRAEKIYQKRSSGFPVIVSGRKFFFPEEIIQNLEEIKKDADEPSLPDSILEWGKSEEKPRWEDEIIIQLREEMLSRRIWIAFFTKGGCKKCERTEKMLLYLKKKYPEIFVKIYNTLDREHQKVQEAISIVYNVPDNERLIAPTIFICDTFLIEDEITEKSIEKILIENKHRVFSSPWVKSEKYKKFVNSGIVERFKNFGVIVVFLAGLVDGVNPCAFATIVFFLSFMTIIGRTKREIIVTGITFVSVLFLVYLLIGLFLYKIVGLEFFFSIRHFLYYAIAGLAFVLAVISIIDAIMLAKGKAEKIILRLPKLVKRRIEKTIVKKSKLKNYILSAFISAVVVSFLEFSCTGQIYIPTIFFVSGISTMKLKALWFLILYNLAFVFPIFLLFLLFVIGLSSEKLYAFMRKRTFILKIATAVIFLALAISLILIR